MGQRDSTFLFPSCGSVSAVQEKRKGQVIFPPKAISIACLPFHIIPNRHVMVPVHIKKSTREGQSGLRSMFGQAQGNPQTCRQATNNKVQRASRSCETALQDLSFHYLGHPKWQLEVLWYSYTMFYLKVRQDRNRSWRPGGGKPVGDKGKSWGYGVMRRQNQRPQEKGKTRCFSLEMPRIQYGCLTCKSFAEVWTLPTSIVSGKRIPKGSEFKPPWPVLWSNVNSNPQPSHPHLLSFSDPAHLRLVQSTPNHPEEVFCSFSPWASQEEKRTA